MYRLEHGNRFIMDKSLYFDDCKTGMRYTVSPVLITREKILSFAREYDPLPFHLDEQYAKTTVFGKLIAPGVMSFMSVWAEFVKLNVWGDSMVAGKSTKIEWFKPVFIGDTLNGEIIITGLTPMSNNVGIVELTVNIFNQRQIQVIKDITEMLIRRRGKNPVAPPR